VRLEDVPIPEDAEERARRVATAAFAERTPAPRRRTHWRPIVAVAVVAACAGMLASPPGRSVIRSIRKAVGVEHAAPALFRLPAQGHVLVNSTRGAWVASADGSKRLLGTWGEASWSPFGRYVVAVGKDGIVAMDPAGMIHWTLSRPAPLVPAWGGKRDDTRIAYVSLGRLRVLAGDGTGDAARCGAALPVAPAWQPGSLRVLAYASGRQVQVVDVVTCRILFRRPGPFSKLPFSKLQWSSDGKLLLAFSPYEVRVFDLHGRVVGADDPSDATRDEDATFVTGTHTVFVARLHGGSTDVFDLATGKSVFSAGPVSQVVSSPDGRWLLVPWPSADQWVFVRVRAPHAIRAYSGIKSQFGTGTFPVVAGWTAK
jgi:hypothetical protein